MNQLHKPVDIFHLISKYTNTIGPQNNNKPNLLFMACHHALNQFTDKEMRFGNTATYIYNKFTPQMDIINLEKFIASFYCIFASHKVIYNLPSMMNQSISESGVSCHRFFGESISIGVCYFDW